MRPTAMQEPHNKDRNKLKSQAPPTPPPKNTTMITVVCNGNRSASSSSSSLTDSGQNSYTGTKSSNGVFISSVTVGDARKKDPPPVTPREKRNRLVFMTPSPASSVKSSPAVSVRTSPSSSEKSSPAASVRSSPTLSVKSPMAVANIHSSASAPVLKPSGQTAATPLPSPKPPPTVLPRVNSGNNTSSHGWTTVSLDAKGRPNNPDPQDVTESAFLASLPALPPDDYVASTLTSHHSKPISPTQTTQQSNLQNSSSGIATAPSSSRIVVSSSAPTKKPTPPPPPPPKSIPRAPPLPPPSPHKLGPPAKAQQSHAPHTTGKPVSPRPPAMTGISENGTSHEEDEHQDDDNGVDDLLRERFYVNMKSGVPSGSGPGGAETTFAGLRDVTNPKSLHEKQIVSSKGTVRGFRNRVRAGIVTFVDPNLSSKTSEEVDEGTVQNYRESEKGKIVVYTTSVMVVRETAERCKVTRNILQTHMVRFEQRDLHMTPEHQRELRRRLETDLPLPLPQIFIDGVHLGGAQDLEKLNESGELRKILHSFPKIQVRTMCDTCGGYRYVLCGSCHGSKRSVHRNNFTEEFFALRCMHCDDNGLQRCQDCADQQE